MLPTTFTHAHIIHESITNECNNRSQIKRLFCREILAKINSTIHLQ